MDHLTAALVRRGHQVTVLTAGPADGEELRAGVLVQRIRCGARPGRVGPRAWLSFLARAPRRIRAVESSRRPDAVLSFFPVVAGTAVRTAGIRAPHVTTFVGADVHDPTRPWVAADANPVVRLLTARVLRRSAAVTAGSTDMVERLRRLFPGREVRRVPLGVPPPAASCGEGGARRGPGEALRVVSVCRLVRRKRLDVLLEAAALARAPVQVELIGDGPALAGLRRRARNLGLGARVQFAGVLGEEEKRARLAAADLFCLPSAHEAFGLAIVEALGAGLPVLTTDRGGQVDIVRDGVEGLLVPAGNARRLAEALERLHGEPESLRRMGQAAAERARQFTPEVTADGFLEILAPLVSGGGGRP